MILPVFPVIILLFLASCSAPNDGEQIEPIVLTGEKVGIGSEESVFEIAYADDTIVVAHLFSGSCRLKMFDLDEPDNSYEFLNVGRGPFEVAHSVVKSTRDTLYVLSRTPSGIEGVLTIPLCACDDISQWDYDGISEYADISGGGDLAVSQDSYMILGEKYGKPNILTAVTRNKEHKVHSFAFWPNDGYEGSVISKQTLYMNTSKIFTNGDKMLYACGEGRYVSILDYSSGMVKEHPVYGEYPEYEQDTDGLNVRRSSKSKRGVYAYATDSLIYISPLECLIRDGKYIPSEYKGYPPYYNDRIEVYDWDGYLIGIYVLDKPFCNFYVSDDDTSLYTLTADKETMYSEVYRYRL